MLQEKHFGFYPDPLGIDAGPITISSRPDLQQIASDVLASDTVEDGWIYAPAQRSRDIVSGRVRQLPYPSRVFGLPHTHMIEHATGAHEDHLDFLIWALSFFVGMRLTPTEAGFLDATPLKPGKLVDFIVPGANLTRAVELAEDFWIKNLAEPGRGKALRGCCPRPFPWPAPAESGVREVRVPLYSDGRLLQADDRRQGPRSR